MIICLGPCCVPLHCLLPFLLAWLHRQGYLQWFKEEWVTFGYWKKLVLGAGAAKPSAKESASCKSGCCDGDAAGAEPEETKKNS
mmetsp:Transcript_934/g.2387  ORF Transcript_934/g.2387 Transcript_934/m.2387 type:complete len:84 (-) Transcript_934:1099-1350(-)